MSAPVEGLPRIVPAAVAESVLRHSQHNGFPVYDPLHSNPQVIWVGARAAVQPTHWCMERRCCESGGRGVMAPAPRPRGSGWLASHSYFL